MRKRVPNVANELCISTMTSPSHQGAAAAQKKEAVTHHSARWQLPQCQFSAAKDCLGSVSDHQLADTKKILEEATEFLSGIFR